MKSLVQALVLATALAAPIASFAQSNLPVTRAQVRAELAQLVKAGYNPARGTDPYYPDDIQAAEARVAAQNGGMTGFGGTVSDSSASGAAAEARHTASRDFTLIFFGQ